MNRILATRVVFKAAMLFVLLNLAYAWLNPGDALGKLSIYNFLVPGRVRLPYGEDAARAYNLSLDSLTAMFASHEIVQARAADEYRVIVLGDSSVWGILLRPDETLSSQINAARLSLPDGQRIRAYNLGHPILSLSKDLLILDEAMNYQPDMIVWLTTLRSFPRDQQLVAPLVQHNANRVRHVFGQFGLNYPLGDSRLASPGLLERSIVGQRRTLADWLRLQLYGVMWGITGIDQDYPDAFERPTSDFDADQSWESYQTPQSLSEEDLAFDVLVAGHDLAGNIPVLMVNEPMFISAGENSDLRYNLWYPRWAYDAYRAIYQEVAARQGWAYVDLWDMMDPSQFTDSPVHLTPQGSQQLATRLGGEIYRLTQRTLPHG